MGISLARFLEATTFAASFVFWSLPLGLGMRSPRPTVSDGAAPNAVMAGVFRT